MNLNHTLKFYKYRIRQKAELLNEVKPLQDFFLPMINGNRTSILDVGAGPFSTVGTFHPTINVDVTACDLYADEYAAMLDEAGIIPLKRTEKQDMEKLSYADQTFEIVYCENALDHTTNAFTALNELERVSRQWVYLRHFPTVGERNHYKGLHQWNLDHRGRLYNETIVIDLIARGYEIEKAGRMVVARLNKCQI